MLVDTELGTKVSLREVLDSSSFLEEEKESCLIRLIKLKWLRNTALFVIKFLQVDKVGGIMARYIILKRWSTFLEKILVLLVRLRKKKEIRIWWVLNFSYPLLLLKILSLLWCYLFKSKRFEWSLIVNQIRIKSFGGVLDSGSDFGEEVDLYLVW